MNRTDNEIAGTHLGQKSAYAEVYDPTLLVAVPRAPNREAIGVDSENTPWKYAYDVWNCYEISSLLKNGQPFSGVGKLVYSGNSECIVESKSLKLYLNSFNQTRTKADNIDDAYVELKEIIEQDLTLLLDTKVSFCISYSCSTMWNIRNSVYGYLSTGNNSLECFDNIDSFIQTTDITKYTEDPSLLSVSTKLGNVASTYHSSNLFSRCQITHQPDHADLYISSYGASVTVSSLNAYIASFRGHSCFHEPTVETIYKRLYDVLQPKELMVAALYTRRGGISIAPVRASHEHLVPYNLINHCIPHVKLPRE